MKYPVTNYATLVFDCDGVVLDSNKVKTEAFYHATLPYGEVAAQAMVAYHVSNGGISRYVKFKHFLDELIPSSSNGPGLDELLESYAQHVRSGLMRCEITPGLEKLREASSGARWLIASGGDQAELIEVFSARGLDVFFDGGIFGSPTAKDQILARELSEHERSAATLFIGDSRYDHVVSEEFGLDFVFVSQWTEFEGWEEYCQAHGLVSIEQPADLLQA